MKFRGRCACGKVAYETDADPVVMMNCHCRDCQRASGTAFAALVLFPVDRFQLLGELKYFAVISERGTTLERGFCPNCGNPVTIKPARPDMIFIQAASLDDPSLYKPTANIWVRSAAPWDHMDAALPRFERMR